MRYIIIICIYFLYSVGYVNSKNFEKCSSNNNSFEIDECLKKLKSKLMNKNEEYSYDFESNYSITSGNAGHIMVLIDKKVRGKIGKKGQVVDSLVLSKDFSN